MYTFSTCVLLCQTLGLSEDNSTNHKGGVHLEEHHEAYTNMSSVLKSIDVPDELDWRDYGEITKDKGKIKLFSQELLRLFQREAFQ